MSTSASPLTIRNDGVETWTPDADIHFSYWWYTTGGQREEGMRTDLPGDVAPGGLVALDVNIDVPETAGVYRLQWDMVQEHVLWFSEQDRVAQNQAFIVVLPAAHAGFPVWPALAVLIGALILLRWSGAEGLRGSALGGSVLALSDVLWCAVSLYTKQQGVLTEEWPLKPEAGYAGVALSAAVVVPL